MTTGDNTTTNIDPGSLGNVITETTLLIIIIITSVVGNVSLWIVVLRSKALRTVTNMFILGLSAADLLVATVNMPVTVYVVTTGYWRLSYSSCVATGYLNMLTLVTSVMSLCNISINRYFMVVKPGQFQKIYSPRNAVFMIIAVLTMSVFLSSPPLIGWSEYAYNATHSFCFADWVNHPSYAFFMIGCCFGIPFGVMTVCNIFIFRRVRQSRRRVKTVGIGRASNVSHSGISPEPSSMISNDPDVLNETIPSKLAELSTECSTESSKTCSSDGTTSSSEKERTRHHNESLMFRRQVRPHSERILRPMLKIEASYSSSLELISVSSNDSETPCMPSHNAQNNNQNSYNNLIKREVGRTSVRFNTNDNINPNFLHSSWTSANREKSMSTTTIGNISTQSCTDIEVTLPENVRPQQPETVLSPIVEVMETKQSILRTQNPKPKSPRRFSIHSLGKQREEVRLAVTLAVVVVIFVICWLPYCVSMLLSIFYPFPIPREFHMFTLVIGYANSGVNPILYGLMNKRFKMGYKRLFCSWSKKSKDLLTTSSF